MFPIGKTLGFPYMAHISPSGLCNLWCAVCPAHDPEAKGKTLLPFETFKKFIDETGDYLLYIILWSWGEPVLNPDFYRMVSYAREKNILTVTSVNLNRFSREEAISMVQSGLDALIIALDGVSEETYSQYRKGGSAGRVIENTKLLLEEKEKSDSNKPFVNLRMVVSRGNEHEIEGFRRIARALRVDMVSFKTFSTRQPGYTDPELDEKYAPRSEKFRWYKYLPGYVADKKKKMYECKFPWTKPTLFADGEVLSCEFDFRYEYSFGNINRKAFRDIWFGPRAQEFRKQFKKNRDSISFCRDCVFDYKLIPGCVIEWEILKS